MYSWHLSTNKHLISATTLCISLECIDITKNDTRTFQCQTLYHLRCKHYVRCLKVLKQRHSRMLTELFHFGCYRLQQLVFVNFKSQTSWHICWNSRFYHTQLSSVVLLILLDWKRTKYDRTACIVASLAGRLPELFPIPSPTSLLEQRIPLTEGCFRWWFPAKRITNSSHSKCGFLLGIGYWNTHFTETPFSTTAVLAPLVARHGNSTNLVTHLSVFCVRFCAIQFVSSITLKLSCILCVQTVL